VVADDGVGGLTHRAVAARAGVPLAATTYYFASKSDLVIESFEHLVADRIRELDAAIAATPARMSVELAAASWAHVMAENLRATRWRLVAEQELHLHASRVDALRAIHRAWEARAMDYFEVAMAALGSGAPRADAALVLAALTGFQVGELADPTPALERDLLGPLLLRLLGALLRR
jgi:TetR/AcrR family transcriptional regulator, regulator of biofilm formation and stress response